MLASGLILGFNRQRQRFNSPKVQRSRGFRVPLLLFQLLEVQTVRAINEKDQRQHRQAYLPIEELAEITDARSQRGTQQVIWKRPEVGALPYRRY